MKPINRSGRHPGAVLMGASCVLLLAVGLAGAQAQSFPEEDSRYSMTPVEDGFLRLDTRTGAMSLCQREEGAWVCKQIADDAPAPSADMSDAAREIEALREENRRLRLQPGQGKRSSDRLGEAPYAGPPYSDSPPRTPERERSQLPSEEEVDRMMDLMERFIERFKGIIERLEGEGRRPI